MTEATKKARGGRREGAGRPPKGEAALPEGYDFIVRPTQKQATYLGLTSLVGMTKQDIVRQALDEFIDRQTSKAGK